MGNTMHYYSAVEGRAFRRPGTNTFIGAVRRQGGFDINTEAVVPIPEAEIAKYRKDYVMAKRRGDLQERTEADFKAWQDKRAARSKKIAEERKAKAGKAKAEAAPQVEDPVAEPDMPAEDAEDTDGGEDDTPTRKRRKKH